MAFLTGDDLPAATAEKIANPPRARVLANAAQTMTNNAFVALRFPEQDFVVSIGHDPVTNPTYFAAQIAGLYELTGACSWGTNGTGLRALKWQKNSVDIPGSGSNMAAYTPGQPTLAARTVQVDLAVGDFVTLLSYQNSGAGLDTYVTADYVRSSMSIRLIRDNSL